jgi:hypothetical protein
MASKFAPKKSATQKAAAAAKPAAKGGKTIKIAGSKNMTTKDVKAAGAKGGFSFKGSGRSQAYIASAKGALAGGATAAQAHKAATASDSAAYTG